MKIKRILALFVLLVLGIAIYVFYGQRTIKDNDGSHSGTVEATSSGLSFSAGGRVVAVYFKEGQRVASGQLLAELDPREIDAIVDQEGANVQRARNKIEQATLALGVTGKTLPQEVERAGAELTASRSRLANAEADRERFLRLHADGLVATREMDTVKLAYDVAREKLTDAQAKLQQAQSNLGKITLGEKELEESQTNLKLAQARLAQTEVQKGNTKLFAPFGGIIVKKAIELGEVVTPGREVLTLADLSRVEVKIYVAETQIGKVIPGQAAEVVVDTFPSRKFGGTVAFISPEAEFTPKMVQTPKERVKLVYLVKILVENPQLALKPGMPAEVFLR